MSDNLKELASKLSSIARKKSLKGKDMDVLKEVRDGLAGIQLQLKECDICSGVVPGVIRIEVDGVKAAVCQDCGIM
ncbi:MAG: hypothetical protein ABIA63_00085, partial [bacterium]